MVTPDAGRVLTRCGPLNSTAVKLCLGLPIPLGFVLGTCGCVASTYLLGAVGLTGSTAAIYIVTFEPIYGMTAGFLFIIGTLVLAAKRSSARLDGTILTVRLFRTVSVDLATANTIGLQEVVPLRGRARMVMTVAGQLGVVRLVVPHGLAPADAADLSTLAAVVHRSPATGAQETARWLHYSALRWR
jgi:hypothetical protein